MVTRTVYKHIRGFVVIWLSITLIVAVATFLAIYFTYNPDAADPGASIPLPLDTPVDDADATAVVSETVSTAIPAPSATATPIPPTATEYFPMPALEATEEPTPTNTPSPPTPTALPVDNMRYQVGIQVEHAPDLVPGNQDNWYNSVSNDLGLNWVKQQVLWESMESERGNIDWGALDLVMPSAEKFDIKLMLSIVTAPDWAREPGANLERHGPPADPRLFADFVAEIVNRYPGRIHAIEVWNEQNIDREWTSVNGLSADDYIALLRETYETIKAINPGIIVISGALTPTGVNDGVTAVDDFSYMDQLIDAGMLEWADCVGAQHNGYNIGPEYRYNEIPDDPAAVFRGPFDNPHHSWSFRSTLEGYANRVRAVGIDTKLCVTEFGWPSAEDLDGVSARFSFALDNTLAEQAQWIPEAMSKMADWDFVWLAFIWNFNYGPQAGWAADNDNVPYSLIGPDFVYRPAYGAIREWQRQFTASAGN